MTGNPRSRGMPLRIVAALGLSVGAHAAMAQVDVAQVNNGVSIGPSEALEPPATPPPASGDHLFGDWGGLRTQLHNYGIDVTLDWVAEVAGNVSGGVQQGTTYAGQVGVGRRYRRRKAARDQGIFNPYGLVNRQGANDSPCSATI